MLPQSRLEQIHKGKKHKDALKSMEKHGHKSECWGIYDGVMVIYDEDDPPSWLAKVFADADENGETPEFRERQKHPA
jgi:hypothetical protein